MQLKKLDFKMKTSFTNFSKKILNYGEIMFAEFNNVAKEVYNNMYDHGMKSIALMEDSQKQFIALSY